MTRRRIDPAATFEKDLPALDATGSRFSFHGFIVLTVDESCLIERTEEFYSTGFPTGVPFTN